jgi:hypothetical protein
MADLNSRRASEGAQAGVAGVCKTATTTGRTLKRREKMRGAGLTRQGRSDIEGQDEIFMPNG